MDDKIRRRLQEAGRSAFGALVLCLSLTLTLNEVKAAGEAAVERVFAREGVVYAIQGGVTNPVEKEITLPNDIRVMTNATFRVKDGKERKLQEKQILGADGMLTSPDGSVVPVMDHVTMTKGQVMISRDGETSRLQTDQYFGDVARATPDGYIYRADGSRVRLMDGQLYTLDGQLIPSKDTVSLIEGKVRVQKDGSSFEVAPGRSLMMNDGTKVFGNGMVVARDGASKQLAEGEIMTIEGVARVR